MKWQNACAACGGKHVYTHGYRIIPLCPRVNTHILHMHTLHVGINVSHCHLQLFFIYILNEALLQHSNFKEFCNYFKSNTSVVKVQNLFLKTYFKK